MAVTTYKWPVIDKEAVCALQDGPGGGGDLLFNGTLYSSDIPDQVSLISSNFSRSVSVTSTNNVSGVNFIIEGLQNGAYVTETIVGPNNTTVYGSQIFDIIKSVKTDNNANQVSVGTGKVGFLPIIPINYDTIINLSVSVILPAGSGITYSMLRTIEELPSAFVPYDTATSLFPGFGLTNMTTTGIGNVQEMTNYVLLKVNDSTNPETDTFDFIFIQQG